MIQWRKWIWPGAIAGALALALAYAYWPRAVPVDVAQITQGPMVVTVEDDAVTRVRESYVISAPISGRLLRVEAHVGDDVDSGKTVLGQIMPVDPGLWDARTRRELEFTTSAARAARDLAGAAIRAAEARLTEARQEFERSKQLFAKGHVAKARLERAETALKTASADLTTAQAALRQREFDVKTAETALMAPSEISSTGTKRFYDVRSPVGGKVLRLIQESEGVIQAGQPLVEIGDPANLEVVVDLLSTDAVKVAPGDVAEIRRWGGEGVLKGLVHRVEPSGVRKVSSLGIEEQRVNVIIDITDRADRWLRLGHGYQVDAAVILWRDDNALQVPIGALFRNAGKWAVFVVRGGRATLQEIEVGHINETSAQVIRGLKVGDTVVTHPSDRVQEGVLITPRDS